jgi:hypothetical protein
VLAVTRLDAGDVMNISGATVVLDHRQITNGGQIVWTGDNITVSDQGTIVTDFGTFVLQTSGTITNSDGLAGNFVLQNKGLLNNTNVPGSATIGIPVVNNGGLISTSFDLNFTSFSQSAGTTEVLSGTLAIPGPAIQTGGTTQILGTLSTNTFIDNGGLIELDFGSIVGSVQVDAGARFNGAGFIQGSFNTDGDTQFTGDTEITGLFIQTGAASVTRLGAGNVSVGASSHADGGSLILEGGTLTATLFAVNQGATLMGFGTIAGSLENGGTVSIGSANAAGTILVTGNYTQSSTGTLNIKLGGTQAGQFDQLLVTGTATIDGTLNVTLLPAFVPQKQQSFSILQSTGRIRGRFATVNLPGGARLRYNPHDVIVFIP